MNRFRLVLTCGLLVAVMSLAARADSPAPSSPAEEVLQSKGLTKFGNSYVLEPDLKLGEWLHVTQATERKLKDARRRRAQLEQDLNQAVAMLENLKAQNEKQTYVLEHISKSADGTYNHQVDIVNGIRKKLRQCIDIGKQRDTALQNFPEPTEDEYVAIVEKLSNMMELVSRRYQELAADPQVKLAIDSINQTASPPLKLGPSLRFAQQLPVTRRLRDTVAPTIVRLDAIRGVPAVPVTLNDSVKEDMVIESGAAYLCITSAVATQLGLRPDPSAQFVSVPAGDGATAQARLATIKSVRLGEFIVDNVPCAIEPASMAGAKNILGASVLKHFIYHLDLPGGALRLSSIDARPAKGSMAAASAGEEASGQLPSVPPMPDSVH